MIVQQIFIFLQGIRLKTLPTMWMPIILSSVWVFYKTNYLDKKIFFYTLLSASFLLFAVNLFNDALDFTQGVDSKDRKGPDRLSQKGIVPYQKVIIYGWICIGLAILFGVPLVLKGGKIILFLGLASCFLTYFYSGTKFSLARTGLSDIFVILFFGFVASKGTYYLQTLDWDIGLLILGFQCGLWSLCFLIINNLRDEAEDRKANRNTLVVRFGREFGLLQFAVAQSLIYLTSFYWLNYDIYSGIFSFLTVPFSIFLICKICLTKASKKYNTFLFYNSLLYILFSILWIGGFYKQWM